MRFGYSIYSTVKPQKSTFNSYILFFYRFVTLTDLQTNPVSGKACSPTKGGLICLHMPPLLASQTTEFVICISIYIRLHAVTLFPPPRSLVPRLGLGNTWVRQLRSGSCHYHTAATKCNVGRLANKPRQWKSMLTH